jgi:hypothetical protein
VKTFAFSPLAVVIIPLKKPVPLIGVQGVSKADCVTECAEGKKWNSTVSPLAAVMVLGEKAIVPSPTLTTWTPGAEAVLDEAAGADVVEEESPPPPPY